MNGAGEPHRQWGLAMILAGLPGAGAATGWLLDRLLGTFPVLLALGAVGGILLTIVGAQLVFAELVDDVPAPGDGMRGAGRGPAAAGFRVLVVEPDPEMLAAVSHRLHDARLQVAGVPSGRLALRVAERDGVPDLLLADLALPDLPVGSLVTSLSAQARAPVTVGYLSRDPTPVARYGGHPVLCPPFGPDRLMALFDELFLGGTEPAR
jgi:CheY-like chemotaxis protein